MKRMIFTLIMMLTMSVGVNAQQTSGTLKLFYTNKATNLKYIEEEYEKKVKKGELIAEINSTDKEALIEKGSIYQLTVPAGSVTETFIVNKADVDVKTYNYSPIPVSRIGNGMYFKSKDGLNARVFKSNSNGHKYIGATKDEMKYLGTNINSCYVLSLESVDEDGSKYFIENPIPVENGNVLSQAYFFFHWASGDDTKTYYDQAGRLLCDLRDDFAGCDYVVGYISSENALYFDGKLYYYTDMKPSVAAPTTSATSQTLDDLPIDEIFKLVDQPVSSEKLLAAQKYKFVGTYGEGGGYQNTWCRNCTCNKQGNVISFQKGTSSIICISESMGSGGATLAIEVFNTAARDAVLDALNKIGFKVDNSIRDASLQTMSELGIKEEQNKEWTTFSRKSEQWGQTADVQKSKKGWIFTVWPIAADTEE